MMYQIILSEYMDRQVTTKPPKEGFKTYNEAYLWALKIYGSTAINCIIANIDMGCEIKEV